MSEPSRRVSEIWWEETKDGRDLHVVFADDGSEQVYKNAHMSNYDDGSGKRSQTVAITQTRFTGDCEC
jgi:hypothetical protein